MKAYLRCAFMKSLATTNYSTFFGFAVTFTMFSLSGIFLKPVYGMAMGSVICYKLVFGLLMLLMLACTEKLDELKITTKKNFILPFSGSLIYYRISRHLKAQDFCIISLIKPVVGIFFAYMILHQQILSYTLEGDACILTGVVQAGTKSNTCSNTNLRENTIYRYFNHEYCPSGHDRSLLHTF